MSYDPNYSWEPKSDLPFPESHSLCVSSRLAAPSVPSEKLTLSVWCPAEAVSVSIQTAQKHSRVLICHRQFLLSWSFLEILKLIELCSLVPFVLESWPDGLPRRLCRLDQWQLGSSCRCESVRNWGKRIITVFEQATHLSFL